MAAVSEIFYQLLRCPPRSSMLCIFPPFLSQTSLNTSPPADLLQHFKGSKPCPTQPFLNGMSFILVLTLLGFVRIDPMRTVVNGGPAEEGLPRPSVATASHASPDFNRLHRFYPAPQAFPIKSNPIHFTGLRRSDLWNNVLRPP